MDLNMPADYSNEFVEIQTIYEPYESTITASAFDPHQELFWTGNNEGRITSYYGISLSKYTSFKMSTQIDTVNFDIKMLYPHANNEIFVLTSDAIASYKNFGVNTFVHREVSFQNLQFMHMNHHDRLFLGGFTNNIFDFDIERLRVLRQLSIANEQSDCIIMKCSPISHASSRNGILCTGSSNGQIILRDPSSLKFLHKFHPHSGSLSDFEVHGNQLVTCGFSLTRGGNLGVDRFLMVYDLRMMRSLSPVQLIIEPCFLHFLPMCSSVIAVGSQSGCFQLNDTNLMAPSAIYQAQVPPGLATTFSMSSNTHCFAFGHSTGTIHLFSRGENVLFNDYSEPTLMVEPPSFNNNYIDINHEFAPISSVPVPISSNQTQLVSDWPTVNAVPKYRPTPIINQELLDNARVIHGIISVPNRIDLKRNQVFNESYENYLRDLETNSKKTSISLLEMIKPEETSANNETNHKDDKNENLPETSNENNAEQATENHDDDDKSKTQEDQEVEKKL